MKIEDDDIISLNWDLFDKHITKCKKIISEIFFCGITRIVNNYHCQCEDLEK